MVKREDGLPDNWRLEHEKDVQKRTGRTLTTRQIKFAEFYAEGVYTAKEAARLAGYKPTNRNLIEVSMMLLDPEQYPHVVALIHDIREQDRLYHGVTLDGQLKRLHQLSRGAEDANQFSAAINAEKLRSVLGGLTVDRRENINKIDDMTREQIVERLEALRGKFPQAFDIIDGTYQEAQDEEKRELEKLNHVRTRIETLANDEEESPE